MTRRRSAALASLVVAVVLVGGAALAAEHQLDAQQRVEPSAPGPTATTGAVPPGNAAVLRQVHTPAIVVVDVHLTPGGCDLIVLNQNAGTYLPDPACTPGATDPAVTPANLSQTICRSGYTKTVRPTEAATSVVKTESADAYKRPRNKTSELDHLVPLELGGASSVSNLWIEPNAAGARSFTNPKDLVENALNKAVCTHQVSLVAAQQAIAQNWTTALHQLALRP